jgi:hypothetical protein
MGRSTFTKAFDPIRSLPGAAILRGLTTAVVGPIYHAYRIGYPQSAIRMRSVSRHGVPLPWYSYPCIEFLAQLSFSGRRVLEFGGGQSSAWWGARAESVFTIECEVEWAERIKSFSPRNVRVAVVEYTSGAECVAGASAALRGQEAFDLVIIDGMMRLDVIPLAKEMLAPAGAIICDNATSLGCEYWPILAGSGFSRVDFHGVAPGVIHPDCTSIYFRPACFLFDNTQPVVSAF